MKLVLFTVEIDNFKSFVGKPHTIDLIDMGVGLHHITGRNDAEPRLGANGVGKSTIWDAVTWCFYGKTVGGLRNPDVRAWKGTKKTRVQVELVSGKEAYTIQRTANPNKLLLNDEDVGQEAIDSLVGMDLATWVQTVLFGQGQPLFLDMTPGDKMKLFASVLDLERWERRAKKADAKAAEEQREINLAERDLAAARAGVEEVERTIERVTEQGNAWEDAQKRRRADATKMVEESTEILDKIKHEFDQAGLAWDAAELNIKHIESALETVDAEFRALDNQRHAKKVEVRDAAAAVDKLHQEAKQLGSATTCPHCGQSLKGTALEKHRLEVDNRLDEAVQLLYVRENELEELGPQWETLSARHTKLKDDLREETQTIASMRSTRDRLNSRIATLEVEIREANRTLQESAKEENPHRAHLSDLRKRRAKLEKEVDEILADLDDIRAAVDRYRFWVKGFRDVRLFIIEELLAELEFVATAMLEEVGLIGWAMRFDIEKETGSGSIQRGINVTILSPANEGPVRWECWSGGEGQRLRLVGALALSEVLLNHANVQPSLEVLDEPTRHLSEEGVQDMCDFLADRAADLGKQIFYIDHQAVESARFTSTLTVVKDAEGSRLE